MTMIAESDIARLLRPSQAAARLQCSSQTVRNLVEKGALACIETPNGRLLNPADVERLAAERQRARAGRVQHYRAHGD